MNLKDLVGETTIDNLPLITQGLKLLELIEKWRKEVYLQLNEIANSKRAGNDYHLQVLNLHTKIVELLMESKK